MASYGVVPWFADAGRLPREDAFDVGADVARAGDIRIAVPVLSRIANFDDLDPLRAEPDVSVVMVPAGKAMPGDVDLILLPGSKATLADLAFIRAQGWDIDIAAHVRRGGAVLGICGGYQMLGKTVADPDGIEGPPAEAPGLGLLDVSTTLTTAKKLEAVSGRERQTNTPVTGYEMHVGVTTGPDTARPMLLLTSGPDGAISTDHRITGCYIHGLFSSDAFRTAYLARLRPAVRVTSNYEAGIDATLDALAGHLERHLDLDRMIDV
jgi:adenosylcobyric acid synthase